MAARKVGHHNPNYGKKAPDRLRNRMRVGRKRASARRAQREQQRIRMVLKKIKRIEAEEREEEEREMRKEEMEEDLLHPTAHPP